MGDVYVVDFGDPIGHEQGNRRPALVVSPDRFNRTPSRIAVTVPVTSRDRGIPRHIPIDPDGCGLDRPSWVRTEDIRTVSHQRLLRFLGAVSADELSEVRAMVGTQLGFTPPPR